MKTIQAVFAVASLTLTACGTATVAHRDTTGGQVALSGGYMSSVREARVLMAEDCHGLFDVSDFQHGLNYHCQTRPAPLPTTVSLAKR